MIINGTVYALQLWRNFTTSVLGEILKDKPVYITGVFLTWNSFFLIPWCYLDANIGTSIGKPQRMFHISLQYLSAKATPSSRLRLQECLPKDRTTIKFLTLSDWNATTSLSPYDLREISENQEWINRTSHSTQELHSICTWWCWYSQYSRHQKSSQKLDACFVQT